LVPLRGLAVEGRGPRFDYALAHTPAFVARLEQYFAMPYPFSKLDLLAIPSQQSAMENAALITYGEYSVLLGPTASLAQQRGYAYIHAHELAHQWFGDSVTMRWWDDLWLNEAFATFLSFKIVQDWEPAYRAEENLVESSLAAMSADRLASARRIREPIETVDDIINAFDGITYSKGAGVLNMLDGYLGATTLRWDRTHLKRHAGFGGYAVTSSAALTQSSGRTEPDDIIETFTEQPGTPIDVRLNRSTTQPTLELSQRRYLPVGPAAAIWCDAGCTRLRRLRPGARAMRVAARSLPGRSCGHNTVSDMADAESRRTWLLPLAHGRCAAESSMR
jgi:alanyl aminopeptidase